ncbi:MGMT family protein [Streptomyces sp. NPDC038707]|uniref:Methylated-DNA--protein-cysteine methyltransferase n=1 Tax=Streptomyces achromogenes subsp. streptozoticus TaxID=285532 RepID=A0A411MR79_STRC2|nr:O6-methylguanine-DNA--protein-cysteine methyltransferase [Streptomyces achromogenes subsp. streptozoticus]QBA82198.1 O6-methylguanine-DNA--protein-cysteine methyltransferase [Streptomyces achromogenes subsp. streptozoticus]QBF29326.1 methylated-DNA--protein-cysteine methyltransferase [Streptomyces achromogenes subsp. streptozoticus]
MRSDREVPRLDAARPGLAGLVTEPPADFAARVLRRAGVPRERYDTYVRLGTAAGGLYVAASPEAVTGAALDTGGLTAPGFEELHRSRTNRSALRSAKPFPGVTTALRTGRARRLPIDLSPLAPADRAVLEAVRAIPAGQLRPVGWIAREAAVDPAAVPGALALNPAAVLIPCHRVTYDNGTPCDAGYLPGAGEALRAAEGIEPGRVAELRRRGVVFLGSDTTRIYCHPTCAHARRITPPHQVPFRTAREAGRAGYRACKSCRPLTA